MKWLITLLLVSGVAFAESEPKKFPIATFDGGLNSSYSGLGIADNEVQDSLNVYFDGRFPVEKREGYALCGSTDAVSMDSSWSYSDAGNNGWIIIRKPTKIIASNQGCSFTVTIATVSASDTINAVNAFGYIYFVDRTQGVYSWNGTSTTYVAGSPRGSLIAEFRGRLWVSGLAHPYGNQLFSSGYLNGTDWTLGSLPTSPVLLTFGLNDSYDNITSIFSGYNDSMQIFKNLSIYALYGFDQTDFEARILNREVGCIDNRSVQPFLGGLVFASRRGVEFFDGVTVQTPPISDKVGNLLNNNGVTTSSELSWTQTSQSDFESGASSRTAYLSFTAVPGAVVVSSFSATDTTQADFGQGSFSNGMSSTTVSNSVSLNNFLTDTFPNLNNYTQRCGVGGVAAGEVSPSTNVVILENTTRLSAFNSSDLVVTFDLRNGTSGAPSVGLPFELAVLTSGAITGYVIGVKNISTTQETLYIGRVGSPYGGWNNGSSICNAPGTAAGFDTIIASFTYTRDASVHSFRFIRNATTGSTQGYRDGTLLVSGTDTTFSSSSVVGVTTTGSGAAGFFYLSNLNITARSGVFTSRTFDSGGFDYGFAYSTAGWTVNTSTVGIILQTSTSTLGAWTNVAVSTDAGGASRRYLRYLSTFSVTGTQSVSSSLDDVYLVFRTTGSYYSAVFNAPSITTFGSLSVTKQDNGGTHTFYMRSSTGPFSVTGANPPWVSQGANTTISISTGVYFQVRDDFSVTSATQVPTLNDFSVSWREGTPRQPMASVVVDKRYLLAFSTSTAVNSNTGMLVLTKGPVWSFWDIRAGSLLSHRGAYYSTNNTDNGKVYTLFSGTSDDATAINAYIKTKDFALGDVTQDKLMDSFYLIFDSLGSTNITTKYFLDRQPTEYSLASVAQNEATGLNTAKLNFPLAAATPNYGKTLSFKIGTNDTETSLNLHGAILNYRTRMTD